MWCFRHVPKTGVNSQLKLHSQLEILIIHSKRRWSEIPEMVEAVNEQGRLTVWGKCQHIGPWASLPAEPFASLHHKGYRLCQLQLDQTMPSSPLRLPTHLYTPPSPSVFLCLFISLSLSLFLFQCRHVFPKARISKFPHPHQGHWIEFEPFMTKLMTNDTSHHI